MDPLKKVLIAILVLSLLTFIVLFGQLPALRKTPIGWLQRALSVRLPNGLRFLDQKLTGGRVTGRAQRLSHYLLYEKNPIVLIIFLSLVIASSTLFINATWSRLPLALRVPIPPIVLAPLYLTYLTVTSTSHYVTSVSLQARLRDWPYDHILFRPKTYCRTCDQPKPARSKHCSLCGYCVAKCDHHCPWVNNCLGRGNYRHFLALLWMLGLMQAYGAYLAYYVLSPYLRMSIAFSPTDPDYWSQLGNAVMRAMNAGGVSVAGVGMLAASTTCLPLGLLGYHLYLIWAGMTTNESQKWADWRDDMRDGHVFKASRADLRRHNQLRKCGGGGMANRNGQLNPALDVDDCEEDDDPWPLQSDQIVVATSDGKPPQGQEALWKRIWSLDEVDNIYDRGGWENLMEVLRGR